MQSLTINVIALHLDSDMHSPQKHTIHVKDKISKLVFFTQKKYKYKII